MVGYRCVITTITTVHFINQPKSGHFGTYAWKPWILEGRGREPIGKLVEFIQQTLSKLENSAIISLWGIWLMARSSTGNWRMGSFGIWGNKATTSKGDEWEFRQGAISLIAWRRVTKVLTEYKKSWNQCRLEVIGGGDIQNHRETLWTLGRS